MMVKPTIQVVYYISGGDFEPDDITLTLGITPTTSRSTKEALVKEYSDAFWALKTEKIESYYVQSVFMKLIDILQTKEEEISIIYNTYKCEMRFTVNIWIEDYERPEILLEKNVLQFVNNIGADIAFDIFID